MSSMTNIHPTVAQAFTGIMPVQPVAKIAPVQKGVDFEIKTDTVFMAKLDNELQMAEYHFKQGQNHLANVRRMVNEILPEAVRGNR